MTTPTKPNLARATRELISDALDLSQLSDADLFAFEAEALAEIMGDAERDERLWNDALDSGDQKIRD